VSCCFQVTFATLQLFLIPHNLFSRQKKSARRPGKNEGGEQKKTVAALLQMK
jgi:hypothetical protein